MMRPPDAAKPYPAFIREWPEQARPREAFAPAVKESAVAVVFAHNHPSGDPAPSEADRRLTRRLKETGDLLGIRVLEHIIVGEGDYYSFADQGVL